MKHTIKQLFLLLSGVLFLLMFVPKTNAQTFNGGFVLGLNASQIDGDDLGGYNKAGLVSGVYVYTMLKQNISAQGEIRYSGKGSATHKDSPYIRKIRLQYIEMPITFGYHLKNLRAEGGLSFGYMFKADVYETGWRDFADPPSDTDVELTFGINYQLFKHLGVNARYSYSLYYIQDDDRGLVYYIGPWYNNVVTFGLYYRFLGDGFGN